MAADKFQSWRTSTTDRSSTAEAAAAGMLEVVDKIRICLFSKTRREARPHLPFLHRS